MNTKLESENSILMQDIMRLRASLSEKNSQMSNRYTVAALETKIESYEKEIKQLQKALDKSDKYIADLEQKLQISPSASSNKLADNKTNDNNVIISDNTATKNVKFSDKVDKIQLKETISNDENMSSNVSSLTSSAKKLNIIPKDNFYGSPSKTPNKTPNKMTPSKALANSEAINKISSFSDRLKMMNNASSSEQSTSVASSTLEHNNQPALLNADQQLLLGNNERGTVNSSASLAGNWFSPMKRLRIEETQNEATLAYFCPISSSSLTSNLNLNTCQSQETSDQSYHLLTSDSNSASNCLENISNIPTTTYFNPDFINFNFTSNQPNLSVFQTYQLENFTQSMFQPADQFGTNSNVPKRDNF